MMNINHCTKLDTILSHLVSQTVASFGSLRILVANAGISAHYGPFECLDPENTESEAKRVIGMPEMVPVAASIV